MGKQSLGHEPAGKSLARQASKLQPLLYCSASISIVLGAHLAPLFHPHLKFLSPVNVRLLYQARQPNPAVGDWWAVYDAGLESIRAWTFEHRHIWPGGPLCPDLLPLGSRTVPFLPSSPTVVRERRRG